MDIISVFEDKFKFSINRSIAPILLPKLEPFNSTEDKLSAIFSFLLESDFHLVARESLPSDFKSMHDTVVRGCYFLQVDEMVDISCARYKKGKEANKNRCLKLHMTDGAQMIIGLEYRSIPELTLDYKAGFKICLVNFYVRRGICMIRPENIKVLGGSVERLRKAQVYSEEHLEKQRDQMELYIRKLVGDTENQEILPWAWEFLEDDDNPSILGQLPSTKQIHNKIEEVFNNTENIKLLFNLMKERAIEGTYSSVVVRFRDILKFNMLADDIYEMDASVEDGTGIITVKFKKWHLRSTIGVEYEDTSSSENTAANLLRYFSSFYGLLQLKCEIIENQCTYSVLSMSSL